MTRKPRSAMTPELALYKKKKIDVSGKAVIRLDFENEKRTLLGRRAAFQLDVLVL